MTTLLVVLSWIFSVSTIVFALVVFFVDFSDVWRLYGFIPLCMSIAAFPLTVTVFPLVLGVGYGVWVPAIATYIILPILWLITKLFGKVLPDD